MTMRSTLSAEFSRLCVKCRNSTPHFVLSPERIKKIYLIYSFLVGIEPYLQSQAVPLRHDGLNLPFVNNFKDFFLNIRRLHIHISFLAFLKYYSTLRKKKLISKIAWSVSRRRGFESRYVEMFIRFLNKYSYIILYMTHSVATNKTYNSICIVDSKSTDN